MAQKWDTRPSSTPADLLGVHVWSEHEAICVGKNGTCLWWDGRSWTADALPIQEDLYAVWGPEPSEVFAVGGNLHVGGQSKVCHFSHGKWTVYPSGIQSLLLAVRGRSGTDVMAVGFNGGVVKRVDDRFEEASADTNDHLFGIDAMDDGSWWVVGLNGTLRKHSQGEWVAHDVTAAHLNGVCFNGNEEGVAVAHNGEVLCYVAESWAVCRPAVACLYGVSSSGPGSYVAVGAAGMILEGGPSVQWRIVTPPTSASLHAVSSCAGLCIAVGANGVIVHGS